MGGPGSGPIKTSLLIEAQAKGFTAVSEAVNKLGAELQTSFNKVPQVMSRMNSEMEKVRTSVDTLSSSVSKLSTSMKSVGSAATSSTNPLKNMSYSIKSLYEGMEYLIQIQMRWYSTRLVLDTIAAGFAAATTGAFKYIAALDQAAAEMIRFSATSGKISPEARMGTRSAVAAMRVAAIEKPVVMKDLSEIGQAFVGAGIAEQTVADMLPMLANLKTAFGEIDMKQFAVAVTAAFNNFKDQLQMAGTEAEKFKTIVETLLRGQAVGIIRPEEFTKVIQYMGVVSKLSDFTLQQMIAIAVAVTDTGQKASSAGRLTASFMTALQQPKARQELKKLNIEMDATKTLASQFDSIVSQLLSKTKAGGGAVPVGIMSFFGGMMGKEQGRAFVAFLTQYEKYIKLTEGLKTVGGSLDLAASEMTLTSGAQWKIFLNILDALSAAVSGLSEGSLRNLTSVLVDMSSGMLFALDSTHAFDEKIQGLGRAGTFTYNAFALLKDVVSTLTTAITSFGTAILFPISGLTNVVGWTLQWKDAMALLAGAITAYLVKLALPALIVLMARIAAVFSSAHGLVMIMTKGVGQLAPSVMQLNVAFGVLAVGVTAIILLFRALNAEYDALDKRDREFSARMASAKDKFNAVKEFNKALQAEEQIKKPDLSKYTATSATQQIVLDQMFKKDMDAYNERKRLAAYETAVARKNVQDIYDAEKEKKDAGLPIIPKEDTHLLSDVSAIKKTYNSAIEAIKSGEKEQLAELEVHHYKGLISASEYEAKRLQIIRDAGDMEIFFLTDKREKIEKEFERRIGGVSGKGADERTRNLKATMVSELEAIDNAIKVSRDKTYTQELATEKKVYEEKTKIAIEGFKQREKLAQIFINTQSDLRKSEIARDREITEFLYKEREISAITYYNRMSQLLQKELENETNTLIDHAKKVEERKRAELVKVGVKSPRGMAIMGELVVDKEQLEADLTKAVEGTKTKGLGLELKKALDFSALFGTKGIGAVWDKTLKDMFEEFTDWGKQLNGLFSETCKALSDTFKEAFIDLAEGNLKGLWDYFNSFAKAVRNAMFQILAQQLAAATLLGSGAAASGIWGLLKGAFSTPTLTAHEGGKIPSFHIGGLVGDERMVKVLTDERVLSREQSSMFEKMAAGGNAPSIEFNLYNQSGQPLTAKVSQPKMTGFNKMVVDAFIQDYQAFGPSYHLMRGGR